MALILALDSSGDAFSAAVNAGGAADAITAASVQRADVPQAACALPLIRELLQAQGTTLAECDAFAFAAGPGKFSALRLVCAMARSFAYAHGKPLLAVPGFAALAQANFSAEMAEGTEVKCALPAHREHLYTATCRREGGSWRVHGARVLHAVGANKSTSKGASSASIRHACGAGYPLYPHLLAAAAFCDNAPYSHAAAVWQVAQGMLAQHSTSDPLQCEPLYLRRQVAQTTRQRAMQKQQQHQAQQ